MPDRDRRLIVVDDETWNWFRDFGKRQLGPGRVTVAATLNLIRSILEEYDAD